MDANTPVTLAVGVHTDPRRAQEDVARLWESRPSEPSGHLAVAELAKDSAGSFRIVRHQSTTTNVAWGGALLGAALVLVVPTAAAGYLASVPSVGGAGAVAGHLHRTMRREERERAIGALEGHQNGVVVLAVNRRPEDVEPLLAQAEQTIAMGSIWNGLDRTIEQEIAESQANPSGT